MAMADRETEGAAKKSNSDERTDRGTNPQWNQASHFREKNLNEQTNETGDLRIEPEAYNRSRSNGISGRSAGGIG